MRNLLIGVVVGALAAGLAAFLISVFQARPILSPSASSDTGDLSIRIDAMQEELRLLREAVENANGRRIPMTTTRLPDRPGPGSTSEEDPVREVVVTDPEFEPPWISEMQALLADFRQEVRRDLALRHPDLTELAEEHAEIQWEKLEAMVTEHGVDSMHLTAAMRLQSQANVLKQFGKPNEMWASPKNGKTFWAYTRDWGVPRNFAFAFQEGHVVETWVDE